MLPDTNRRPIAARSSRWAQRAAAWLAQAGISANQISVTSILFSAIGTWLMLVTTSPAGRLGCALAIQCRLICNLLDGMVAIEGGHKSSVGPLYNEFPDRIADTLLIVGLGYASHQPTLGWLGALAAALTAYVRVFGGTLGLPQSFSGPMAKQHRMAVLTIACIVDALESTFLHTHHALQASLWLIAIGAGITCVTRTRAIAKDLSSAETST